MTIQVASAAVDIMRDGHYEGAVRTLLLEGTRTNQFTWSRDLSNAAWTKTRCTATAAATLGPDGTMGASRVTEDASAVTTHSVFRAGFGTASRKQAVSFDVKASERTWIYVEFYTKAGVAKVFNLNLASGATGTVSATISYLVTAFVNGWWHVELAHDAGVGGAAPQLGIYLATGDNGHTYTGDGASGIYLDNLQWEQDAECCSSRIPTTNVTVTRSPDAIYQPFPYTPQAMSVYTKFVERGTFAIGVGGTLSAIWSVTAAGLVTPHLSVYSNGANYEIAHWNGVSSVAADIGTPAPAPGDTVELLGTISGTGAVQITMTVNGAAEQASAVSAALAFGAAWSAQRLYVASRGGNDSGFLALSKLVAARGVQSMSTMRGL